MQMAADNMLPHHRTMHFLKISQTIFSAVILALCTYEVAIMPFNGCVFAFWTALLTLLIMLYYFVELRDQLQIYKVLAILALEVTGFLAWLATCSSLLTVYSILLSYDDTDWLNFNDWSHVDDYCESDKACHEMFDFMARDDRGTFGPVLVVAMALSGVQVILYCMSLSIISKSMYRHSQTGLFAKHSNGSMDSEEAGKSE